MDRKDEPAVEESTQKSESENTTSIDPKPATPTPTIVRRVPKFDWLWLVFAITVPLFVAACLPHGAQIWLRDWSPIVALAFALSNLVVRDRITRAEQPSRALLKTVQVMTVLVVLVPGLKSIAEWKIRRYAPMTELNGHITVTFDREVDVTVWPAGLPIGLFRGQSDRNGSRYWVTVLRSSKGATTWGDRKVTEVYITFTNEGLHRCASLSELSARRLPSQISHFNTQISITKDMHVSRYRTKLIVRANGAHEYIQTSEFLVPNLDGDEYVDVQAPLANARYVSLSGSD